MATSREQFVSMLWPAALEASQRTGIDPRIIVAQAAQETGWGRSAPGNNYFGIKSHGKGGGQTFKTHEIVNGKRVNINDSFRQFESPADSVSGYAEFMTQNQRYRPMREAQGLDAQLAALGQSGYATDPNYAQSVGSIARTLPSPSPLSPEAQDFVNRNPQPGGYGPGIDDPNAPPKTPSVAPPPSPFGSMFPQTADTGLPPFVAQYASAGDTNPMQRLGAALSSIGEGPPAPKISGGGGDARATGNALLEFMASPPIADMFLKRRFR